MIVSMNDKSRHNRSSCPFSLGIKTITQDPWWKHSYMPKGVLTIDLHFLDASQVERPLWLCRLLMTWHLDLLE